MTDQPVLRGVLDTLILRALRLQPMHGFEITTWLEGRSNGAFDIEDGALYHALVRLEQRELVEAEWRITENNRRARYYKITALGRREFKAQSATLLRYAHAITDILGSPA
jgi:transcriptional regulator